MIFPSVSKIKYYMSSLQDWNSMRARIPSTGFWGWRNDDDWNGETMKVENQNLTQVISRGGNERWVLAEGNFPFLIATGTSLFRIGTDNLVLTGIRYLSNKSHNYIKESRSLVTLNTRTPLLFNQIPILLGAIYIWNYKKKGEETNQNPILLPFSSPPLLKSNSNKNNRQILLIQSHPRLNSSALNKLFWSSEVNSISFHPNMSIEILTCS